MIANEKTLYKKPNDKLVYCNYDISILFVDFFQGSKRFRHLFIVVHCM